MNHCTTAPAVQVVVVVVVVVVVTGVVVMVARRGSPSSRTPKFARPKKGTIDQSENQKAILTNQMRKTTVCPPG